LPLEIPPTPAAGEYWLTLRFSLIQPTAWAPAGFEVGSRQLRLDLPAAAPTDLPIDEMPQLRIQPGQARLAVRGRDFTLEFDTVRGRLRRFEARGGVLIESGPQLCFWRALIDNDRQFQPDDPNGWRKARLHQLSERLDEFSWEAPAEQYMRVEIRTRIAPPVKACGFDCTYTYHIYGTGDVILEVSAEPDGELPETLPRLGLRMRMPGDISRAAWFGRGPGEAYIDSREAALVGFYARDLDELHTPYVFPQENGNRHEVRWASLTNVRGEGLLVAGMDMLDFSAHRYSLEDLDAARHRNDLPRRDFVQLHLDHRHHGLGSNSCGPMPLEKHRLLTAPMQFAVRLRPFHGSNDDASALARLRLEH
jgi:beta-galactosidase/evolved beta-galactosidase subunit alpha